MRRLHVVLATLTIFLASAANSGAVEWISRTDLTSREDQQLANQLPNNGYVPIYSKASFTSDGQIRFDVVYLKPLSVVWEYRLLTEPEFERRNRELLSRGYSLVSHQVYRNNNITYHNCIWHK